MPTFAALTTQEISKLYTQQSHSILYTLTKQTMVSKSVSEYVGLSRLFIFIITHLHLNRKSIYHNCRKFLPCYFGQVGPNF